MAKERKPIVSIQIFEAGETDDGEKNYEIEAAVQAGSFTLNWATTTDDIRRYFTERRERQVEATEERHLKAVEDE